MMAGKRFYGDGTEQDDNSRRVRHLIDEVVAKAGAGNANDYIPILRRFTNFEKQVKKLAGRVDEFLQSLVGEKRANKEKGNTMMDHLLSLQEMQPDYYTDVTLKGIIIVSIDNYTGCDTTTTLAQNTICYVLVLRNPFLLCKNTN